MDNAVTLSQGGNANFALVDQNGGGLETTLAQSGNGNRADIGQAGLNSEADILQSGHLNAATIRQAGTGAMNLAQLTQNGGGFSSWNTQSGNNNLINVVQGH